MGQVGSVKPSVFWYLVKEIQNHGAEDRFSLTLEWEAPLESTYIRIDNKKTKINRVRSEARIRYCEENKKIRIDNCDFLLLESENFNPKASTEDFDRGLYVINKRGNVYEAKYCIGCEGYTNDPQDCPVCFEIFKEEEREREKEREYMTRLLLYATLNATQESQGVQKKSYHNNSGEYNKPYQKFNEVKLEKNRFKGYQGDQKKNYHNTSGEYNKPHKKFNDMKLDENQLKEGQRNKDEFNYNSDFPPLK
jgi:hypothetical protein